VEELQSTQESPGYKNSGYIYLGYKSTRVICLGWKVPDFKSMYLSFR